MTLAELIAARKAAGWATPEAAESLGIPAHSIEWMSTAPLVTQGTPWRPTAEIGTKLAAWLGEDLHVVLASIRESHKETTHA